MSCTWIYLVGFLRPTPYVNQICGHLKGLIPPNTPCSWAEEEEAEGAAGKQQQNAVKTSPVLMTDRPRADELAVNTLITQTKVKQSWAEPSWGELSRAGVGGGVLGQPVSDCGREDELVEEAEPQWSVLCGPQASLGMQRGSDSHHLWAFYIWHNLLVDISYFQ